ncbi:MAG: glycogen debranching enzyme N-terminal domain-containing protein [Candidatus Pacebacteria bacterium]|nr:glycogen debranching enzyme N-terminal domain-containing protein [Candidatus Paceibacterota bacterium]
MRFSFQRQHDRSLDDWLDREWLETNSLGGYASSTIANCHTRKYHGLLAVKTHRSHGTALLLSQLEDSLIVNGNTYPLVTHEYPGVLFPESYRYLVRFEQDLYPIMTYACGDVVVRRHYLMPLHKQAILIRYDMQAPPGTVAELRLRPLFAYRNIHETTQENPLADRSVIALKNGMRIHPYKGMPITTLRATSAPRFVLDKIWYRKCQYRRDREREYPHVDDLLSPGELLFKLTPEQPVTMAAVVDEKRKEDPGMMWDREIERRRKAQQERHRQASKAMVDASSRVLYETLIQAAEKMTMILPDGSRAVHAGYHWFGPWGRDALVALPGLTFIPGNMDDGLQVLQSMAKSEKQGLLPNFINSDGSGVYTAADPALWFFWTVQQYLKYNGDPQAVKESLWPTMKRIVRAYKNGTQLNIRADEDGLLTAGAPELLVTWMDVRIGQNPVIRRWGYMVEINALWYNALRFALELSKRFEDPVKGLDTAYCDGVAEAFERKFWNPNSRALADVVRGFYQDITPRPNQLLAVSLPFSPLPENLQQEVIHAVRGRQLLTNYGLRTLTPLDLRYQPTCRGPQWIREMAYHQGSIRPWLLAHYADAVLRVEGRSADVVEEFEPMVSAFVDHLHDAGIGGVSEIFDGDPPHAPQGSIYQAWNIGELIRCMHNLYAER